MLWIDGDEVRSGGWLASTGSRGRAVLERFAFGHACCARALAPLFRFPSVLFE